MKPLHNTCGTCAGTGTHTKWKVSDGELKVAEAETEVCTACGGRGYLEYALFDLEEAKKILEHIGIENKRLGGANMITADTGALSPCPFCGADIKILPCKYNEPGYELYHEISDDPKDRCPIAGHNGEGRLGIWIYDTVEEATKSWNTRSDKPIKDFANSVKKELSDFVPNVPEMNEVVNNTAIEFAANYMWE